MDWTRRRERARALLNGKRCLYPASVFDALSARAAEDLGFELGMFAGSVAALAVAATPDLALLTLTELAEQTRRICRAGDLALIVDADHGYGNALSVRRTVEELETAGVALLTIEDTLLPSAYGAKKAQLISLEEGAGKMRAALDARQDSRLIIAARTSALAISGMADTLARLKAYEAAGVDALFLAGGLKTRAQLDEIAAATRLPILLSNAAAPDVRDAAYMESRRVRVCLQGHQPIQAAVKAAYESMKVQREQGEPPRVEGGAQLVAKLSREAQYAQWEADYLGG